MATRDRPDCPSSRPPTLEELLADDVTRAVMQADHVAAPDVRLLCRAVGDTLAHRTAWS